jgi:hypothetical protein
MPWMIEVFRRDTNGWQSSRRFDGDEQEARDYAAIHTMNNSQLLFRAAWFDERPYSEKLTSEASDQPEGWGYDGMDPRD